MKKAGIVAAAGVAGLACFGVWRVKFREPPDLSEAEARAIAEKELLDFCSNGETVEAICPYFVLKGQQPSSDARFHWSFHYLNERADPWQKVMISVGKKGDRNVEYTAIPVPVPADGAAPPAAEAAPVPAPAAPSEPGSPPPPPGEGEGEGEGEPASP
ncbi:MAG: hypothetical protein HY927_01820 [Elusimicrobia bacterium]|nr:hypothetical protein [Elusimicrobiota bacterium]